jgi:hypothetical protein
MADVIIKNPTGGAVMFEAVEAHVLPSIPATANGLVFTDPTKIFIGTGGTLKCKLWDDDEFNSFLNLPDGQPFFGIIKAIHSDSTVSNVLIIG